MPLSASAQMDAAVDGYPFVRAAKIVADLPTMTGTDLTLNLRSVAGDEEDSTTYPGELAPTSGVVGFGGSIVLGGVLMLRLLNPDDPSSALYRDAVKGSKVTIWLGQWPKGGTPELIQRAVVYITDVQTDVAAGTITLDYADTPPSFYNELDSLPAVLVPPPGNAGLTNEFVIDRICRAASAGVFSSWQAPRPNALLAVGLRASLAPEVGTLLSGGVPTFAAGVFGTGLAGVDSTGLSWQLATDPDLSALTLEILRWEATTGSSYLTIANTSTQAIIVQRNGADLTVTLGTGAGPSHTFTGVLNTTGPEQYLLLAASVTTGVVTLTVDATVYTTTITGSVPTGVSQPRPILGVFTLSGVIEGVIISTEAVTASNYNFTPLLACDPSLNVLQAVPPVAAGTLPWQELQTVVESEGAWLGWINGVLTFRNRDTIKAQTVQRAALQPLDTGVQATSGQSDEYAGVSVQQTDWTFADGGLVWQAGPVWAVAPGPAVSFDKTLPNGATGLVVEGPIQWLPDGHDPTDPADTGYYGENWMRWSLDRFGNREFPSDLIDGTVTQVDSATFRITLHNRSRRVAYGCSPSTYVSPAGFLGKPSIWIGGQLVTPDTTPTIIKRTYGTGKVYAVPQNPYHQDVDSVTEFVYDRRSLLRKAKTVYQTVSIIPDPRILSGDRGVLNVPVAGGGTTPVDVYIWGVAFNYDFDPAQPACDMSVSVRALAPPGAWKLGVSRLGTDNYIYPAN